MGWNWVRLLENHFKKSYYVYNWIHFDTFQYILKYIPIHFNTFQYISIHFKTFQYISIHFSTFLVILRHCKVSMKLILPILLILILSFQYLAQLWQWRNAKLHYVLFRVFLIFLQLVSARSPIVIQSAIRSESSSLITPVVLSITRVRLYTFPIVSIQPKTPSGAPRFFSGETLLLSWLFTSSVFVGTSRTTKVVE